MSAAPAPALVPRRRAAVATDCRDGTAPSASGASSHGTSRRADRRASSTATPSTRRRGRSAAKRGPARGRRASGASFAWPAGLRSLVVGRRRGELVTATTSAAPASASSLTGRRVPVVGTFDVVDGETVVIPANRGSRRGDNLATLDGLRRPDRRSCGDPRPPVDGGGGRHSPRCSASTWTPRSLRALDPWTQSAERPRRRAGAPRTDREAGTRSKSSEPGDVGSRNSGTNAGTNATRPQRPRSTELRHSARGRRQRRNHWRAGQTAVGLRRAPSGRVRLRRGS